MPRREGIEDNCLASVDGWHNWMVYAHDAHWHRVGVGCTRCRKRRVTTARELDIYVTIRDEVWDREHAYDATERASELQPE